MLIESLDEYAALIEALAQATDAERRELVRQLCRTDLYFLLRYGCNRRDIEHAWLFDRCREVQASPNGHLDLWAREHYKSTIITFGLTIFDILNDPEVTIGLFSHTRPVAKAFLRQIKRELETNEHLKLWFPDILWSNPAKEAPKWSEDDGLVVRRKDNPKESTIEAWGLVDGQPTSKHYRVRTYDDVVVPASVTTPMMIAKTNEAWQLSDNLGMEGGVFRVAGTRYHNNDTYSEMMRGKVVKPRVYACTIDGSDNFTPDNCVLMSPETLTNKRRNQGLYTFSTQMLLKPAGDEAMGFKREWLRKTQGVQSPTTALNVYIIVDPANTQRKKSDYTAMWVIGLGLDNNYVALDVLRDKLTLTQRTDRLFELVQQWRPICVFYEEYGLQADIEHIRHLQGQRNYRFDIHKVGGSVSKPDRIRRLMPLFEQGRIWLPERRMRTLYDHSTVDLVDAFIEEEYVPHPVAQHDDLLDCLARIADPDIKNLMRWPISTMHGANGRVFSSVSSMSPTSTNPNRSRYARGRGSSNSGFGAGGYDRSGRHKSGNTPGEQG